MAVTLASLIVQVRERADMVNSNFVLDPELTIYINNSAKELYDILVSRFEDQFLYTDPNTFETPTATISSEANNFFDVTDQLYKLRGVDKLVSGDKWITLTKFNFNDRNTFLSQGPRAYFGQVAVQYRFMDQKILILPKSSSVGTYRYWYIPKFTDLTAEIDLPASMDMWSEYIVVDSAIKCLVKEESDTSALQLAKQQLTARIEAMAANRDAGMPDKVSNVRNISGIGYDYGGDPWQ